MALLKNTTVSGSLRATDTISALTAQFKILNAPTTSNGTTYGPGSNGNFLKSNGTSIYWVNLAAADIPTISITDKTSGTLTVARGGTDATTAAGARTNLGLGSIAVKADTDYVPFKGNITSIGSSSPASGAKTYWADTANIPNLSTALAYNNAGNEYTLLFSKGGNNNYGSILKWGYPDKYIRILRYHCSNGTNSDHWYSEDWEKISAGYADSAGSATNLAAKPSLATSGTTQITVTAGGRTSDAYTVPYATKATQDGDGNTISSTYLKLDGGTMTGGLEIKGHIAGDSSTSTGHGLYSGGMYHNAYNNIILHGDATTGSSGIAFVSDKIASDGTITNINAPSDRAFIQYHAYGVTTATAEVSTPTLATSGEAGRLVIGIGNDSGDKIILQAPGAADIVHQMGATGYPIPHTTNTNGSVGGTTTPVYVDGGVIKAGTALGASAYHADSYFALSGHTHTTTLVSGGTATVTLSANTSYTLTAGGTSVIFKTPVDNNNYVNQSATTTSNWRKVLLHYSSESTATASVANSTNVVYGAVGVSVQPSTGTLRASAFNTNDKVTLQWNNDDQTLDFVFA